MDEGARRLTGRRRLTDASGRGGLRRHQFTVSVSSAEVVWAGFFFDPGVRADTISVLEPGARLGVTRPVMRPASVRWSPLGKVLIVLEGGVCGPVTRHPLSGPYRPIVGDPGGIANLSGAGGTCRLFSLSGGVHLPETTAQAMSGVPTPASLLAGAVPVRPAVYDPGWSGCEASGCHIHQG